MKRKKIIHFLPVSDKAKGRTGKTGDVPLNIYLASWAALQAKNTLRYTSQYDLELWTTDRKSEQYESAKVENIEYRLYPMRKNKRYVRLTRALIKDLKKEVNNNQVLLNFHIIPALETTILAFLFRKCPIVLHHHGSIHYEFRGNKHVFKGLIRKILTFIDKKILRMIDYFSVISIMEKKYLVRFIDPDKVKLEQGRKFFKEWKPLAKKTARNILGIDQEKKVIIYIGYYYRLKGVDSLLKAYYKLKKNYEVELLMIGGKSTDELYDQVKASGARDLGRVSNSEIPIHLSAADVYVLSSFDENLTLFGGLGTAVIEALACDVPVVSRQLIHFPTDERQKVGEIPQTPKEVAPCIEKIFNHPDSYSPRETSRKYYDFELIIKDNIRIYDKLFKEYYGAG